MLMLTRHAGESIVVGNDIVLFVDDVYGDKVRLHIDVPPGVTVRRGEDKDASTQGPEAAR